MEIFGINSKAFIDSFGGLIPCIVREIRKVANGHIVGERNELLVEVSVTMGGYKKGELVERSACYTPPRRMIVRKKYSSRILTNYQYQP